MMLIAIHKKMFTRHRVMPLLLFVLYVSSCAAPSLPGPDRLAQPKKNMPRFSTVDMEQQIHVLVNKERQKSGLSPVKWDDALARIARKHSADMARRNYFSHNSPEGHDFSYRYNAEGYACGIRVEQRIYQGAENLFQNNLYDRAVHSGNTTRYDWNSMKKIAESTVRGWMNSPGHKKNILTPAWRNEGVGVIIAPDDKVYITENFC